MSGLGWCGQSSFLPTKSREIKVDNKSMGALADIIKKSKNNRQEPEKKRKRRKRKHSNDYEDIDYSKLKVRNSKLDDIKREFKVQKTMEEDEPCADPSVQQEPSKEDKFEDFKDKIKDGKGPETTEEIDFIRQKLTQKAQLYDALASSSDTKIVGANAQELTLNGDILVNFEQKKEEEELRKLDPKNKYAEFSRYKIKRKKK
ncbi:unnamed protein product [Moneuplotes crassus]|uniref:Uncharacterized protein n=1 Tax=Euplotes crassus TaxID=5936 RepID=A0AAD1XWD4_EUPCR|nr:unnamed protein product [Moneuplotes crassus]